MQQRKRRALRALAVVFFALFVVAVLSGDALAAGLGTSGQELANKLHQWKDFRGPGHYFSLFKIFTIWILFACWVYSTDWVSNDARELALRHPISYLRWNPIVFGSFMGGMLLVWLIPIFWLGLPILLGAYIVPLYMYVKERNSLLEDDQRVFTKGHIRYWISQRLAVIGIKIEAEPLNPYDKGAEVKLLARVGKTDATNTALQAKMQQEAGQIDARLIIEDALRVRADALELGVTAGDMTVRVRVDGVWQSRPSIPSQKAAPAVAALKVICGLDPADRTTKREATFAAILDGQTHEATLNCGAAGSGEVVRMQFQQKGFTLKTLDEMGMRPAMQKELAEVTGAKRGIVLFSTMPRAGLRTLTNAALKSCDSFTRTMVAIEEKSARYEPVEGVPVKEYDAAKGESPREMLPKMFREDPDVIVIRDLPDAATVQIMADEMADEDRLLISTMRARDAVEAIARLMKLGVPGKVLAQTAVGVLSQRLIRVLCEQCKEPYAPPDQLLQQLRIPPERVKAFYRPPSPIGPDGKPRKPCPKCGGIGYFGRTGLFELLVIGDTMRRVLASSQPSMDLLRKAARKDGVRSVQEEGVLMVIKGVTSMDEVKRVLQGE